MHLNPPKNIEERNQNTCHLGVIVILEVIGGYHGPVHLIKSRSGVSSFYRPHKASLTATSTHSSPWHPVPPQAREDEILLRAANLPDS